MAPSQSVCSVVTEDKSPLQLRVRYFMPDWKSREKQSNLWRTDTRAFQYFYTQVRQDFVSGLVCNNTKLAEKDQRFWIPVFYPDINPKKKNENDETLKMKAFNLVIFNIAVDIVDGRIDRKDIFKHLKQQLPKDATNRAEMLFFPIMKSNFENQVNLQVSRNSSEGNSLSIQDQFLKAVWSNYPSYFCESFPALYDEVDRVAAVRLALLAPEEDKPVRLLMVHPEIEKGYDLVATIDDICNIAVKDGKDIEFSRKNGVPMYFRMTSSTDQTSFLNLLCSYYRLSEKWNFSLSTEVVFPILEKLSSSKVHGPISKSFAEDKMRKMKFSKGTYLLRQCFENHNKLYLHYCSRDGRRPLEAVILEDEEGKYQLENLEDLPVQLREKFCSVGDLIRALRNTASHLELATPVHPSEFDKDRGLLLCRTDKQWREDSLGTKHEDGEKIIINATALAKMEVTLREGRYCSVWNGKWYKHKDIPAKEVAIKQLKRDWMSSHQLQFIEMSKRMMSWDDASLIDVFGFCLPCQSEPPVLVTEYFHLGPLHTYLRNHKSDLAPVDLLETSACLARALHYLSDKGLVHGDIRARNVFVASRSEHQFKVKLCEGSLDGPRKEDVHWLDFQQLRSAISGQKIVPSLAGDTWALGTTLWEIFSYGEPPPADWSWQLMAEKYLNGIRLQWPSQGTLTLPLQNIVSDCWHPDHNLRKRPQVLMRDINQLLYKVFNSRRKHEYCDLEASPSPATLTPAPSLSSHSSFSMDIPTPPQDCGFVPLFKEVSRKMLEFNFTNTDSEFGSNSPLICHSGGSRSGSIFNTDMSALTCQTSLDWSSVGGAGNYSMASIYQLDDSHVEYNKEFPLGEGNFGVVYKGVRTKSDGDWEEVAIKEIKETDTMSSQAHDDMEREVNLMKKLSHENIVKIRGVLADGANTIIVMEFIREGSLDRYLVVNKLNIDYPKQLFVYAQNIVDGMEYLGQNNIIHRDLAARNILVSFTNNV